MVNKGRIELEELEAEICRIISTGKSSKEKAGLICENLTAFKRQRMIETNKIQTEIYDLRNKSVSADDFALQKLDMEMDIILLRLLEITYEKNRFGKITKSIPGVILKYVKREFARKMMD